MAKIIKEGVTQDELERAKAQAIASHVYQRDSMMFQAREIGALEMTGISHRTIDLQLRKLREVTAEQVREVARKYSSTTRSPSPTSIRSRSRASVRRRRRRECAMGK